MHSAAATKVTAAAHGVRSATATAAGTAAATSAAPSWRCNSGTSKQGNKRGNGEQLGFGHETHHFEHESLRCDDITGYRTTAVRL
jgi:hypothetical protein